MFSKWTGLKFVEFLKEKIEKLPFGLREKKKGKTVKVREKLEKLEKKPVNVLGFFSKCPWLKNKNTPLIKSL